MWLVHITDDIGSTRNDGKGIQLWVRRKVVYLDVIHVHATGHTRHLIQFTHIVSNVMLLPEEGKVRFEIHNVDLVEANECGEESYIRLCEGRSHEVSTLREDVLQTIQGIEQNDDLFIICSLCQRVYKSRTCCVYGVYSVYIACI